MQRGGASRERAVGCQAVGVKRDTAGQVPPGAGLVVGEVAGYQPRREEAPWEATARRWQEAERRRRKLAERLARDLAHPDPDAPPGALSDFVAATAVQVRWARNVEAQIAFELAPRVVALGGEVGRVEGRGGVILWVHSLGDDFWSLVVPFEPFDGPVLVCTDDFGDHAMWISDDSAESREALTTLHTGLIRALETRREQIAKGTLPPD